MNTLAIRTASGAVYVISVIGSLWFNVLLFQVIMAVYACLVVFEFARLIRMICDRETCSGLQFYFRLIAGSVLWICIPFLFMGLMPQTLLPDFHNRAFTITLSMFVLTWSHDTFAYLIGRWLGRHPLCPSISPAKTIEGALGGGAMTMLLAAGVLHQFIQGFPLIFWVGGAVLVSLGANLGDLAQSKLKRRAGVKDSGRIMPGHGGLFDRFDALLVVSPLWYFWVSLFA